MQRIIYLIAPSEGKTQGGNLGEESISWSLKKPCSIAKNATPKDLKCSGARYEEAVELNTSLCKGLQTQFLAAIYRYSGVMYSAIHYDTMSEGAQHYFDSHFHILSGMYGILKPQDLIGNYKLPIEAKGLVSYWKQAITSCVQDLNADLIVDLLPQSYAKIINWNTLSGRRVRIDFYSQDTQGNTKKLTHSVKKARGEFIYELCEARDTTVFSGAHDIIDITLSNNS